MTIPGHLFYYEDLVTALKEVEVIPSICGVGLLISFLAHILTFLWYADRNSKQQIGDAVCKQQSSH